MIILNLVYSILITAIVQFFFGNEEYSKCNILGYFPNLQPMGSYRASWNGDDTWIVRYSEGTQGYCLGYKDYKQTYQTVEQADEAAKNKAIEAYKRNKCVLLLFVFVISFLIMTLGDA